LKKILLIEDEESLLDVLSMNLTLEGYKLETASTGNDALELIKNTYDLIILDIMLPDVNGFDICEMVRKDSQVPILFISAKGTSTDRIKGLKIGGDDYLVKPFHLEEFLLRVQILIGREEKNANVIETSILNFGENCSINFKTFEVNSRLGLVTFSKREIELLKLFTQKPNEVVSREDILNNIWPENASPNSRTIDNYILNFRKHFEIDPKSPKHFISLRGVGYKFVK
jgi:two-component system alkaline phosphatase synthesis response regulator PhoP